jgi:lipopolysaccharide/colanic/teichoic acid biosynthesis glycosyltransferase
MLKRSLDLVFASIALLFLSPLLLPTAIILRLTGEGEIFYRQQRIGRGGKRFGVLKFATMLKNSVNMPGGDISSRGDPRILPLGHFLRRTKINELPQLLNIVMGDMSMIGPRPLTPGIAAMFDVEHWQALAHLRPGLSGIGSVVFRDEEWLLEGHADRQEVYRATIVPHKAALERWYAAHQTLGVDLKLMVVTVIAVFRPGLDVTQWFPDLPQPSPDLAALRARALA